MADRLRQVRCAMCGWKASGPFYVYDHEHYCEECADDLGAASQETPDGEATDGS